MRSVAQWAAGVLVRAAMAESVTEAGPARPAAVAK